MPSPSTWMLSAAAAAALLFAFLYIRLLVSLNARVQRELQRFRESELESWKKQILAAAEVRFQEWKSAESDAIRQDAVQRSQAVTAGKVAEHVVPWLPGFDFNPKDARFLGSPIDFVVFDGLDAGAVRRVVFVEVKTGAASLSGRERSVRDAVQQRRVEWLELRPAIGAI